MAQPHQRHRRASYRVQVSMMSFLERSLNRYLNLDPAFSDRARDLVGKKIVIELVGTGVTLLMAFDRGGVILRNIVPNDLPMNSGRSFVAKNAPQDDKTDLIIRATPISLLQMKFSQSRPNIEIIGDAFLAQQFNQLFEEMDIDWEEILSKYIGDSPAYHTMQIFKRFKKTGKEVCDSLTRQFSEYLHEEINHFPAKEALQDFYQDVDEFVFAVDRLSARLKKLEESA